MRQVVRAARLKYPQSLIGGFRPVCESRLYPQWRRKVLACARTLLTGVVGKSRHQCWRRLKKSIRMRLNTVENCLATLRSSRMSWRKLRHRSRGLQGSWQSRAGSRPAAVPLSRVFERSQ